jgi:hypothetical protein
MEKDLLKRKARLLTNKQSRLEIDITKPTFFERLFKRPTIKVFFVNRACLSTLAFFSELTLDLTPPDETYEKGMPAMIASLMTDIPLTIRIIGVLIEDTDQEPSESIKKFIGKNLNIQETKSLLTELLLLSRIEDFMSTTILMRKMSLLKTEELIAFEKEHDKTFGQPSEES